MTRKLLTLVLLLLAADTTLAQQRSLGASATASSARDFRGQVGRRVTFVCPAAVPLTTAVWGTDVYSDDSPVCTAAIHAGVLKPSAAGAVTVVIGGAAPTFKGTTRNGVTSRVWGSYPGTFTFDSSGEPGQVDWNTTARLLPTDVELSLIVTCPPQGVLTARVWGTDTYSDDSAVCVAAVHAGILTAATGGRVQVRNAPGEARYKPSVRNGVTSLAWDAHGSSFRVAATPPPAAAAFIGPAPALRSATAVVPPATQGATAVVPPVRPGAPVVPPATQVATAAAPPERPAAPVVPPATQVATAAVPPEQPAAPQAAPAAAAPAQAPAAAPGAPGLRYAAPPGWAAETVAGGTVIFKRTLDQNREAQHQATIWLFAPQAAAQGPAAAFVSEWRSKLGGPNGYALGDGVAHYRRVLPGGPVAYYMGNAFTKVNDRDQDYYSALYVIDLLDGRTQTVGVTVVIGREQYSMSQQNIEDAMRQLVPAMAPLLDSLRYPDGRAPGPLLAAREVQGNWRQSSSVFAGSYVNAATGQGVGVGAASSGSTLSLQADGRYEYYFASYFNNPVAGQGGTATTRHNGRWALQQQVIVLTPDRPLGDDPSEMAVGGGVLNTPQGSRRMLITVGRGRDGQYRQPPWFAVGDSDGAMKWYRADN